MSLTLAETTHGGFTPNRSTLGRRPRARCVYCNTGKGPFMDDGPGKKCCVDDEACEERILRADDDAGIASAGRRPRLRVVPPAPSASAAAPVPQTVPAAAITAAAPAASSAPAAASSPIAMDAPVVRTPSAPPVAASVGAVPTASPAGPLMLGLDRGFPEELVLERLVLLGKPGSGKTNGDTVIAEEFLEHLAARAMVFVLDPLGNMSGIRFGAQRPGYPIAIIGGEHGDIPLNRWQADYYVDAMVESRTSTIFDLSELDTEDQCDFAKAFCSKLMSLPKMPLHVIFEEADIFAPNRIGENPVKRFARMGRNSGFGWTFSTQRPQILSPEVIESSSAIFAMRMVGDLAQVAIGKQAASRVGPKKTAEIIRDLPNLKRGEAWIIPEPDWMPSLNAGDFEAEPERFRFRQRETFDSARPPSLNGIAPEPGPKASIDPAVFVDCRYDDTSTSTNASDTADEADDHEAAAPRADESRRPGRRPIAWDTEDLEQRMLVALVQRFPETATQRPLLAALCGTKVTSGDFVQAISALQERGLVDVRRGFSGGVSLSDTGLVELGLAGVRRLSRTTVG